MIARPLPPRVKRRWPSGPAWRRRLSISRRWRSEEDAMLGDIIASLEDPKAAMAVVAAFEEPALLARLAAAAGETGRSPAEIVGSAVRNFVDTASDDLWTQLIGIMNRARD